MKRRLLSLLLVLIWLSVLLCGCDKDGETSSESSAPPVNYLTGPTVNLALNRPVMGHKMPYRFYKILADSSAEAQSTTAEPASGTKAPPSFYTLPADGWFSVDLGGVYHIGSTRTVYGEDTSRHYTLEVSADNRTWTTVADHTESAVSGLEVEDKFAAVDARYVRYTPQGADVGIKEFQVMGKEEVLIPDEPAVNLCEWKSIEAVNGSPAIHNIGRGVDGYFEIEGFIAYRGQTEGYPIQYTIDLEDVRTVGKFSIGLNTPAPLSYTIEMSDDGETWRTAVDHSVQPVQPYMLYPLIEGMMDSCYYLVDDYAPAKGRYIRYSFVDKCTYPSEKPGSGVYSFNEFAAYESQADAPVESLSLPESLSLEQYAAESLKAAVAPSNAANQLVSWSSSDERVATVSPGGLVKGVSVGTATITAVSADGGKQAQCKVTVTKAEKSGDNTLSSFSIGGHTGTIVDDCILVKMPVSGTAPSSKSGKKTHEAGMDHVIEPEGPANARYTYVCHFPEGYDPANQYPLIVYLHGSGGVTYEVVTAFPWLSHTPAIVLAPELNSEYGKNWSEQKSPLNKFIDYFCKQYAVDTDRISLCGYSLGGHGLYSLGIDDAYRGKYSAFVQVAPAAYPKAAFVEAGIGFEMYEPLKDQKMWFFSGTNDPTVPYDKRIKPIVDKIREYGGNIRVDLLNGQDHAANASTTPGLDDWMTGQRTSLTGHPEADFTALKATFEAAGGAVVSVGETAQESGVTVNDFTYPVTYTLKAANGDIKTYTVVVTPEYQ